MTKMTKKEIIEIIQTLKDHSLTEIMKETRSYVNKCEDIDTFKKLKQLIRIIKYGEQNNSPRLFPKNNPNHINKGLRTKWKENLSKCIWYVEDQKTKRIYKFFINNKHLQDELGRLGIFSNIIVKSGSILFKEYKQKYKAQFKSKIKQNKKIIYIDKVKAIIPEKEFIKGNEKLYSLAYNIKKQCFETSEDYLKICLKNEIIFEFIKWKLVPKEFKQYLTREKKGWVLTEKGKQQQKDLYNTYTTSKNKIVKRSKRLTLTDVSISSYTVKKLERTKLPPVVPQVSKKIKENSISKNKPHHQKMLRLHKKKTKRKNNKKYSIYKIPAEQKKGKNKKYITVQTLAKNNPNVKNTNKSKYKNLEERRKTIKKVWEEKELKLANYINLKKGIKLQHKSYKSAKRYKDLKGYYSYKKIQKYYNKIKEEKKNAKSSK